MYNPLPASAAFVSGVRVTPWMPVPGADYCSMRVIEGTDPEVIANRVAFIEKTPRVRIKAFSDSPNDCHGWHAGWKGDDGWCLEAQGWCDALLVQLGYVVPDAQPYSASASDFSESYLGVIPQQRQRQDASAYQLLDLAVAAGHLGLPAPDVSSLADLRQHHQMPDSLKRSIERMPALAPIRNLAPEQAQLALRALATHLGLYDAMH